MGKKKSKAGAKAAPNSTSPILDSSEDGSVASAAALKPIQASELGQFSEFQSALAEIEAVCNASAQWAAAPHDCVSALDGLARRLETLQSLKSDDERSVPRTDAPREEPSPAEWDLFWDWVEASADGEPSLTRQSTVEVGWFGDAFGNGCRAARDLAAGDVVLRVPTSLMLSLHVGPAASQSPVASLVAADPLLRATPTLGLALLIAHESLQGSASTFAPYLKVLPSSFDVPLSWQPSDLEPLREAAPPVFTRAVNGWRMALKQYAYLAHKAAREPQGFGKHFPVTNDPKANHDPARPLFSLSLFRWALATAITRQNEVPAAAAADSTLALIPLWDMCNHSNSKDTDTSFVAAALNEASSSSLEVSSGGALECRAMRDIAKDEQVYIFYGERPNSDLLLYSGFVPALQPEDASSASLLDALSANPYDRLPTPLTWELEAKEGDASSREALLKVRLLLCRSLGLTPSNNHGTSTWELSLPLSVATVSAAPAAEGGRSDTLSGGSTLERLQLKHAFMASTADVPNSKAWLRACLEKSEGVGTAEPPASIEWSSAALALFQSVLAKHVENASQRTQCAAAAAKAAKGEQALRRADQVRKLVDAEMLLLRAASEHAGGIINS